MSGTEHATSDVDWDVLHAEAVRMTTLAYAPYSGFQVGVAGLVDDGRIVSGCCVDKNGDVLMACGRCRQLLWENGTPETLVRTPEGVRTMREVLPQAFGRDTLDAVSPVRT